MSAQGSVKSPLKLARVSTTDAIVSHIKNRIQTGEFAPGSRLPSERELQAQLGVSRLALREGLARLSALGIIRVAHGKGAFVATEASRAALRDVPTPILVRNDLKRQRPRFQQQCHTTSRRHFTDLYEMPVVVRRWPASRHRQGERI